MAIDLTTLHSEASPPDVTASFALSLVLEQWQRTVRQIDVMQDFIDNLPLANADPRLIDLYGAAFGREIVVDQDTVERARRDGSYEGRPVQRSGKIGRRWMITVGGDRARHLESAAAIVRGVRASNAMFQESYERWPDDPALRPRVTLHFEIDPQIVAFLRVGMTWETTAYC